MLGALNLQHPLPTAVGMPGEAGEKALVAAAQLLQHVHGGGVHAERRDLMGSWFRFGIALLRRPWRFRLDEGSNSRLLWQRQDRAGPPSLANGRNAYRPPESSGYDRKKPVLDGSFQG